MELLIIISSIFRRYEFVLEDQSKQVSNTFLNGLQLAIADFVIDSHLA